MLRADLKAVGGRHDGKLIPLEVDRKFLIGREQDCHLRPNSESVSRHHCCFTLDAFCLRLRDLGSTNGTLVNGEVITGQIRLNQGDRVTVGPLEFEVLLRELDEEAADDEPVPEENVSDETAETTAAAASDDTSDEAAETTAADSEDVLDESDAEPASGETMIDLPADAVGMIDEAANTAVLSDDTTVIPNEEQQQQLQQQQLQQQLAMQQQMAMQQQQQQQQLAMQQQMAMQQQLAMQQQMPFVPQPGMMPGMLPPGFVPQVPAEMLPAQPPAEPVSPAADPLDVTLPDPATTGAKDPEPVAKTDASSEGDEAAGPEDNPSNVAEDIIKQYMHRRPSTGS